MSPFLFLIYAYIVGLYIDTSGGTSVSPPDCLVWGPGLDSRIVLPVRYFFIQARNTLGDNVTKSLGDNAFSVEIALGGSSSRARIWSQVFDRHDGSYIVRFKTMESYTDLEVNILYGGERVAASPYTLAGSVYHEKCNCPEPSFTDWLKTMNCPTSYSQIDRDLAQFERVDMQSVAKEAVARYNNRGAHSLCHYVVKDNRVYRQTHGEHVGFKMFMDAMLLSMTRKVRLPDIEFIVNLGDWPLEEKRHSRTPLPIFSWCGSDDSFDIVMPTYDVTESTLETMGRVSLDLLSVQANTGPAWEEKANMAFWRGRDSRQERLDLVKLSRKHPDIVDAKLTAMFFFKHEPDLGEVVKHVSFFDFFRHKYQIAVDGTVAAYRLPYLLAGDSVVLKQASPYYEHFYAQLSPNVHYIPLKRDLSDLLERLQWAKNNDQKAKEIGQNAQKFVRDNLMAQDIFCYQATLFGEYSRRLIRPPRVLEGMEEVTQATDADSRCECNRSGVKRDEL